MSGRLAISKRFSLADASDDWDDSCHLLYRPARIGDLAELKAKAEEFTSMTDAEAIEFMTKFIRDHFISGKVLVFDASGGTTLADAEAEDINDLPPEVLKDLFAHVSGAGLDPKASLPAAGGVEPSQPVDASTETS